MAAPKVGVLGQVAPAAAVTSALYTVPVTVAPAALRQAVGSTLVACETTGADTTIRVHVGVAGAAAAIGNAEMYEIALPANSRYAFTEGMALGSGDVVYVRSASGNVTFTLHGEETDVPTV